MKNDKNIILKSCDKRVINEISKLNTLSCIAADAQNPNFEGVSPTFDALFASTKENWKDIFNHMSQMKRPSENIFGAYMNDHIVGVVHYGIKEDTHARLHELYVDPDHWGKNIGTKLFNHAINDLHAHGAQTVEVVADSTDPQPNSFYKKMGGYVDVPDVDKLNLYIFSL